MRCQDCESVHENYQAPFEHMKTHEGKNEQFSLEDLEKFFFFQKDSRKAAINLKNKLNYMLRYESDIEMRPNMQRWRQELLWGLILKLSSLMDFYDDFDDIFKETNRLQIHGFSELNHMLRDIIRNGTETISEMKVD